LREHGGRARMVFIEFFKNLPDDSKVDVPRGRLQCP
jgi:hypothetical protein